MLRRPSVSLIASLTALLPLFASAQDAQPVYLVASLKVDDLQAFFEEYGSPVLPQLEEAGAEVIVGTPVVEVLEGGYGSNWTAIVRFPSRDALDAWYASDAYEALAEARRLRTTGEPSFMIVAEEFPQRP